MRRVAFADVRQAVLAALEQAEQLVAHEATHAARQADERARRVVAETIQCAIELDAQVGELGQQLDRTRSRLAAIRERLTAQLHGVEAPGAAPASPAAAAPEGPPPPAPEDAPGPQPPSPPAAGPSPPEPPPSGPSVSADETIRVLRAALEALGRPREGERPG